MFIRSVFVVLVIIATVSVSYTVAKKKYAVPDKKPIVIEQDNIPEFFILKPEKSI